LAYQQLDELSKPKSFMDPQPSSLPINLIIELKKGVRYSYNA